MNERRKNTFITKILKNEKILIVKNLIKIIIKSKYKNIFTKIHHNYKKLYIKS